MVITSGAVSVELPMDSIERVNLQTRGGVCGAPAQHNTHGHNLQTNLRCAERGWELIFALIISQDSKQ